MRVIAGSRRGLLLDAPKGLNTRPTSDRIKETLFNILQNEIQGAVFLDLFAGSGQMGIEALSRGANKAIFVDNHKDAIRCIENNVAHTKFTESAEIRSVPVLDYLKTSREPIFHIVFIDPPYHEGYEEEVLSVLSESAAVTEDTIVIIEADLHTELPFAEQHGFTISRVKKYKTNQHYFLRKNS